MLNYLIVKYVPDLYRREPRNIGVIIYSDNSMSARFYGEPLYDHLSGTLAVPSFVKSPASYRQWIRYWRKNIDFTESLREIQRTVETLKQTSNCNYIIEDGGTLLEILGQGKVEQVTETLVTQLYERLVLSPEDILAQLPKEFELVKTTRDELYATPLRLSDSDQPIKKANIDVVSKSVVTRLGTELNLIVINDYKVDCEIGHSKHPILFNYALKNGQLSYLFERVKLSRTTQATSVEKALKFEKVAEEKILTKERMVALVSLSEREYKKPEIIEALETLSSVATVVNLNEPEDQIVRNIARLSL